MENQFASRTWSSKTFLRGCGILEKQMSMDLTHVHDMVDMEVDAMEQELERLEASVSKNHSRPATQKQRNT